jgi:hypothetical protein
MAPASSVVETPEQAQERLKAGRWVTFAGSVEPHRLPHIREHLIRGSDAPSITCCGMSLRKGGVEDADGSRLPCGACLRVWLNRQQRVEPAWAAGEREVEARLRRALEEREELVTKALELADQLQATERARESWEDWGKGWKAQAEANQVERDKAWAELDAERAKVRAVLEWADALEVAAPTGWTSRLMAKQVRERIIPAGVPADPHLPVLIEGRYVLGQQLGGEDATG